MAISEYVDVGHELPFAFFPWQVKAVSPIKGFNGASVEARGNAGPAAFSLRVFGGNEDTTEILSVGGQTAALELVLNNLLGVSARADWEGFTAHASYTRLSASANLDTGAFEGMALGVGPGAPVLGQAAVPNLTAETVHLLSAGLKFERYNIVAYFEWGLDGSHNGSNMAAATMGQLNGTFLNSANAWYGLLGYRLGNWMPYYMPTQGYYDFGFLTGNQVGHTLGLNWDATKAVDFKVALEITQSTNGLGFLSTANQWAYLGFLGADFVF